MEFDQPTSSTAAQGTNATGHQPNQSIGPPSDQLITIAILNRYNLLLTVKGDHSYWQLPTRQVNQAAMLRTAAGNTIVGKLGVSREDLAYFECIHQTQDFLAFRFMGEDAVLNEGILRSPMSYNWQWQTPSMLFEACPRNEREHYEESLAPILKQKRIIGF